MDRDLVTIPRIGSILVTLLRIGSILVTGRSPGYTLPLPIREGGLPIRIQKFPASLMPRKVEVDYWPYACPLRLEKVVACRVLVGPRMPLGVQCGSVRGAWVGYGRPYGENSLIPAANSSWAKVGAFGPFDGLVIVPINFHLGLVWLVFSPSLSSAVWGSRLWVGLLRR